MTNIYVGNLAYDLTEAELQSAFERFGQVSSVSIVKDRDTGRSRGFGFVEMPDEQQAKQAIEGLNLEPIGSRRVTVNEARPREERPRGGGGGGRDGGGRDGGGRDGGGGGHRRSRGGW